MVKRVLSIRKRSDGLPEDVGQLYISCWAGVEAVGADIFRMSGELALVAEEVYQNDGVLCCQGGDAAVPMLNVEEHLCFLRGSLVGEGW